MQQIFNLYSFNYCTSIAMKTKQLFTYIIRYYRSYNIKQRVQSNICFKCSKIGFFGWFFFYNTTRVQNNNNR